MPNAERDSLHSRMGAREHGFKHRFVMVHFGRLDYVWLYQARLASHPAQTPTTTRRDLREKDNTVSARCREGRDCRYGPPSPHFLATLPSTQMRRSKHTSRTASLSLSSSTSISSTRSAAERRKSFK